MAESRNVAKYDEALTDILVNEKSILGFLSTIFNFLSRRTDFYYIAQGPDDTMGFPPGMNEELVVKVLRSCDPKNWKSPVGNNQPTDINDEIMCSTVAQEVEVVADEDEEIIEDKNPDEESNAPKTEGPVVSKNNEQVAVPSISVDEPPEAPPIIPTQKNSETYNGAKRENYSWAQTIMDLDVTVRLPAEIKSSKQLKVTINTGDICVACLNGDILLKDTLPYKIKTMDSFWTISEGKLLIHLEKVQERWWNRLLSNEEVIDLTKIDCSRPLDDLPDDHVAKIRELQWNQEQKMKGLPTSDQLRNMHILKKAWNAEGSPFKGTEFNPNIFNTQ